MQSEILKNIESKTKKKSNTSGYYTKNLILSSQECNLVILPAILLVWHKHWNKLPSTQVHNGLQWGNNKKPIKQI